MCKRGFQDLCGALGKLTRPLLRSAVIGEIDTDKDATIDFNEVRAEPLPQIHF